MRFIERIYLCYFKKIHNTCVAKQQFLLIIAQTFSKQKIISKNVFFAIARKKQILLKK